VFFLCTVYVLELDVLFSDLGCLHLRIGCLFRSYELLVDWCRRCQALSTDDASYGGGIVNDISVK